MKKYGSLWVPSKSDLIEKAKMLRTMHRNNEGVRFYCMFDPKCGKFIFGRMDSSDECTAEDYINIPYNMGTCYENDWESVDYIRTKILAYVVDKGGSL